MSRAGAAHVTSVATPAGVRSRRAAAIWYIHRARAMSAREVIYRTQQRLRSERQRRLASVWPRLRDVLAVQYGATDQPAIAEAALAIFRQQPRLWRYGQDEDPSIWLRRERPEAVQETLQSAEAIRAGELVLFGRSVRVGARPQWNQDPFDGRAWPLVYWTAVNYRRGGAKYVWELNRHQHLPTLMRAYRLTGDNSYATLALTQMQDWIRHNPHLRGINWTSSLEMALRLTSWVWTLEFGADAPALTAEVFAEILIAVHCQATFISQNLSRFSSANNHLLGEAAGLIAAGTLFPMLRDATRWQVLGSRILSEEMPKQVLVDGGGAEQAFHYLAFVCDLALQSTLLLRRAGLPYSALVDQRLSAAAGFLGYVATGANGAFNVGDADDGRALPLDDGAYSPVAAASARLAVRYGNAAAAQVGRAAETAAVWLMGPGSVEVLRRLAAHPPDRPPRQPFADSGYTVFTARTGAAERHLLFDHGPLGYLSQAAHGHADALSVYYSQGGIPLLVDAGTFTYHEHQHLREFFRGTSAHNTIAVDGQSQSEPVGPTIWGRKARVLNVQSGTAGDDVTWTSAEHDGYTRLPGRIRHRRGVIAIADTHFLVVDELLGTGQHHVDLYWHLPSSAGCTVEDRLVHAWNGDVRLKLQLDLPTRFTVSSVRGQDEPVVQGWTSDHYGSRSPAWTIVASGHASVPATLLTLLADDQADVTIVQASCHSPVSGDHTVTITLHEGSYCRHLRLAGGRVVGAGITRAGHGLGCHVDVGGPSTTGAI